MNRILKFTFNLILFTTLTAKAQEAGSKSVPFPDRYGLRVGIDLHRLSKSFYDNTYQGLELVGDYRISKKFYLAGELGNEKKEIEDDRVYFTTKGNYLKLGFDYNAYENWLDMENMIHLGLRYGFGSFTQELHSYKIYDPTQFFGEHIVTANQEFKGLNASWIEVVGGVKTKLFNNFFLGFSLRLNYLISEKEPTNFANLYIPGFNRTYDGKFGAGLNYTLTYFVPIYKKKK